MTVRELIARLKKIAATEPDLPVVLYDWNEGYLPPWELQDCEIVIASV